MRLSDYTRKLLELARTVHHWIGALNALDPTRRNRVARYAEDIAETLLRASEAMGRLEIDPSDRFAARAVAREFGRIAGYVETLVGVLSQHLDGRKLAGVKRRLDELDPAAPNDVLEPAGRRVHIQRLVAAEGYFRALSDALRV
jgi:hypothetical protein